MSKMIFHGTEMLTHAFCGRSPSGSSANPLRALASDTIGKSAVMTNSHGIFNPIYK